MEESFPCGLLASLWPIHAFRAMGKHINYGKNVHALHLCSTKLNGFVLLARDISPILRNPSDYPLTIVLYAYGTYLAGKCRSCNRLPEQENLIILNQDSWGIARGVRQWHQAVPTCGCHGFAWESPTNRRAIELAKLSSWIHPVDHYTIQLRCGKQE